MDQDPSQNWGEVKCHVFSIFMDEIPYSFGSTGKPVLLNAFGLVTQDNLPFFFPFNSSTTSSDSHGLSRRQAASSGVTNDQQNNAYSQWFQGICLSPTVVLALPHLFHSWASKRRARDVAVPGWSPLFPTIAYLTDVVSGRKAVCQALWVRISRLLSVVPLPALWLPVQLLPQMTVTPLTESGKNPSYSTILGLLTSIQPNQCSLDDTTSLRTICK